MDWSTFLLENEPNIRLIAFLSIFTFIAVSELIIPKRTLRINKARRWINNLSLIFFNTLVLRLIIPFTAIMVASLCQDKGLGLFNLIQIPLWLSTLCSFLLLDLMIYTQHVIFHLVPLFWQLHKVHHSDLDYDLTMASRFHTLEIVLSLLIRCFFITLLGAPVVAVIIFEIILNGAAMFNHGNIALPKKVDTVLRWFIVTPDMHFVHHSIEKDEYNRNFGFNLPWWDRLFNTYKAEPKLGQQKMEIGLKSYPLDNPVISFGRMLMLPFERKSNDSA